MWPNVSTIYSLNDIVTLFNVCQNVANFVKQKKLL